jgi:hypothetical protein
MLAAVPKRNQVDESTKDRWPDGELGEAARTEAYLAAMQRRLVGMRGELSTS